MGFDVRTLTTTVAKHVCMDLVLYPGALSCWKRCRPLRSNEEIDILQNCVLLSSWQQFGNNGPHMGVMFRSDLSDLMSIV